MYKVSFVVEFGDYSWVWYFVLCDCFVVLLVILFVWSLVCFFNLFVEDILVKLLLEFVVGVFVCFKNKFCLCLFKVFIFCGCLKFF